MDKVLDHLMLFVEKESKRKKENLIHDLLIENSILLNTTKSFLYKGEWFVHNSETNLTRSTANRLIHPKVRLQLDNMCKINDFDTIIEYNSIRNYFIQILTTTCNKQDLYNLLPWQLHRAIDSLKLIDTKSMNENEISEFKLKHKKGLDNINQFFITKLLQST